MLGKGPVYHNNDFEFYSVGSGSLVFKAGECWPGVYFKKYALLLLGRLLKGKQS